MTTVTCYVIKEVPRTVEKSCTMHPSQKAGVGGGGGGFTTVRTTMNLLSAGLLHTLRYRYSDDVTIYGIGQS